MKIEEKNEELEEIARLEILQKEEIQISDEDMKIIKFFAENNKKIKFVYFDIFNHYYSIVFEDIDNEDIIAVEIAKKCKSIVKDCVDYYIDLFLVD